MLTRKQVINICHNRLDDIIYLAIKEFPKAKALLHVKRNFNLRGKVGGKACLTGGYNLEIQLNVDAVVAHQDNLTEMLEDVIPHEVAHLVDYCYQGTSSHNVTWRERCKILGGTGNRCHSMVVKPARKTKKHLYRVHGYEVKLSSIRHNRLQRGLTLYKCKFGHINAEDYVGVSYED